jgi:hypothetical protein
MITKRSYGTKTPIKYWLPTNRPDGTICEYHAFAVPSGRLPGRKKCFIFSFRRNVSCFRHHGSKPLYLNPTGANM